MLWAEWLWSKAVHLQHRRDLERLYGAAHTGIAELTCEQAGMQIALRKEAAHALHQNFSAVYLDLQKAYEHLGHRAVADAHAATPL
eukprot:114062-Amphidinium_carterae.2